MSCILPGHWFWYLCFHPRHCNAIKEVSLDFGLFEMDQFSHQRREMKQGNTGLGLLPYVVPWWEFERHPNCNPLVAGPGEWSAGWNSALMSRCRVSSTGLSHMSFSHVAIAFWLILCLHFSFPLIPDTFVWLIFPKQAFFSCYSPA